MSQRQPVVLICLCVGVGLVGLLGSMVPLLSDAEENVGLHLLYLLRGPEPTRDDVVIVAIDDPSADALGLPLTPKQWPRRLHAQLLERLTDQQAGVVVFDLLFHEPQGGDNDQRFSDAMRHTGNVVLAQAIDRQTIPPAEPNEARFQPVTIDRLISAIPVLADAAAAQAPFPLPKVPIQLNQYWCFRSGAGDMPTLPVVAFHIYAREAVVALLRLLVDLDAQLGDRLFMPADSPLDHPTIVRMIGGLHILFEKDRRLAPQLLQRLEHDPPFLEMPAPTRRLIRSLIRLYGYGNSRYLNFYGPPGTVRTLSYHTFVNGRDARRTGPAPSALPKRSAVFVGQTQSHWGKANDGFYTAFYGRSGQDISGVEIAATAFSNLLEDKAVYPLGATTSVILFLGWGIATVAVTRARSTALSATALLLLNGIYVGAAFLHFKSNGIWYPLVVPVLVQTPLAFIAGLAFKYRQASVERENIREAMGYYLPDEVVDRLSANLQALRLGGQVFYGVCLFTDAQNYTRLSESLDPGSLTRLMNAYYEAVFRPVQANGGLVLQVVGDSVMALWTAPSPSAEIKRAACRAAIEITVAVERFNRQAGSHALPTRIGLHAGEMLLGNIGALNHYEYRPVGDIVNTASRLEGLNKFLGTRVLASRDTIALEKGMAARMVGRFVFKGKSLPVEVYELRSRNGHWPAGQDAVVRWFASGLVAFRCGQWEVADERFERALKIDPTDGPSLFYRRRCLAMRQQPPEGHWGGVVCLDQK